MRRRRRVVSVLPVRARLERLLHDERLARAADLAMVGALAIGSLAEIWLRDDPAAAGWGGSRVVASMLAVAATVPLLWRRRHPFATLAVLASASTVIVAVVAPVQAPFEPFVALVVAFYAVGVYAGRVSLSMEIGAFLGACTLVSIPVLALQPEDGWDVAPVLGWFTAAWLAGRYQRRWRERAAELERLTAELAAERDSRAREAVQEERARIARELHDVVAHNVSVMTVQATAAGRVLEADPVAVRGALAAIESVGRSTVDEMRQLLGVLRAPDDELALSPQPSLAGLDALVANVRQAGLPVELVVQGDPVQLPPGIDLSAYRIVQEALTNALKHAGPARARVTVRYTRESVALEIVDDGRGENGRAGSGHGLVGMRERVAVFGGMLEAGTRTDGGWALRAQFPLDQA